MPSHVMAVVGVVLWDHKGSTSNLIPCLLIVLDFDKDKRLLSLL